MPNKKKGILFVINDLRPGGAEMFLLRLAQYLSKDFNIYIYCLFPKNNDLTFLKLFKDTLDFKFVVDAPNELAPFKEKMYWKINALGNMFGVKGIYTLLKKKRNRKYIHSQIKKYNISVINSSGISSDYRSINYFKNNFDIPVVLTMHSDYNKEFWNFGERKEEDFVKLAEGILSNADRILYTADHNMEIFNRFKNYRGTAPEKCYLGFTPGFKKNIRAEMNIPENAFVIVMMARGIKEKGWEEAINAFKMLQKINANSFLILIATETDYILQLKKDNEPNKNIIFKEYQSEPSAFLYSSNCMVLPSYFPESLPYALIESLACSKPVFACPIAEIPNMLTTDNGIAGELIPINGEGKADHLFLADKLIELAKNPLQQKQKEALAIKAFEKFSMEKCGDFYKKRIMEVIK